MAVVTKWNTDRGEAHWAPLSGGLRYEIDQDYTIALELEATLLRGGGQGPTDGHPSPGW